MVYDFRHAVLFLSTVTVFCDLKHESSSLSVKNMGDCMQSHNGSKGTTLDPLFCGVTIPLSILQYARIVDMLLPYSLLCKLNGSAKMSFLLPKILSRGVILYITTQALTVGQYVLTEHAHKRKTRRVYKTIPENANLSFGGGC